jgi:hypothetical protein
MTEPNPYADGEYKWGPGQQPGSPEYDFPPPTLADGQIPPPQPGYGYPNGASPYGYPQPGAAMVPATPAHNGTPLVTIGDITVIGDSIVTPSGTLPLRGAVWNATDLSRTEEKIPAHAVVLAIIFFLFCLIGLLFLLMKERTTTGFIQVTVTSGGVHHSTMIPANNPMAFQAVMGQIAYARSISSM